MYFILNNKYTLSLKFVAAHVRVNNHWSISQVRLYTNLELSHSDFNLKAPLRSQRDFETLPNSRYKIGMANSY
jgi:hypothetical protein